MLRPLLTLALLSLSSAPLWAEDGAALTLELNGAAQVEAACRLTFKVDNGLGADLSALGFETVILTTDGQVERLTLFDFGAVPSGRPRVRQFDLAGLYCARVGQILINGASACEGVAPDLCITNLKLQSRIEQELLG
jgi:hypothetical protein